MNNKLRLRKALVYIILGIAVFAISSAGMIDEFWGGMGTAFIFVGIMQLAKGIKYQTDENYRENVDTGLKDERNRFLAMKAWSWAGYIYVILSGIACIGFKIAGLDEYSYAAGMSVSIIILLYWLSYIVLRKKY